VPLPMRLILVIFPPGSISKPQKLTLHRGPFLEVLKIELSILSKERTHHRPVGNDRMLAQASATACKTAHQNCI